MSSGSHKGIFLAATRKQMVAANDYDELRIWESPVCSTPRAYPPRSGAAAAAVIQSIESSRRPDIPCNSSVATPFRFDGPKRGPPGVHRRRGAGTAGGGGGSRNSPDGPPSGSGGGGGRDPRVLSKYPHGAFAWQAGFKFPPMMLPPFPYSQ